MTPADRDLLLDAFKSLLNTLQELAETCALRDAGPGWKTWLRTQEELEQLQTDIARLEAERL